MSRRKKSKAVELLEYCAVRFFMGLFDLIPLRVAHVIARGGADAAFLIFRRRRSIAIANIIYSGVAVTLRDARRIARDSFRHFAAMVVDTSKSLSGLTEEELLSRVEVDSPQETMELLDSKDQGAILLCGHFGNWEVGGQLLALKKEVSVIAKKPKNSRIREYFEKRQVRPGYTFLNKRRPDFRWLAKNLKGGGVVALLMDQYAGGASGFPFPFFGRKTATHTSPALLYRLSRVPIIMNSTIVTGQMKFRVELSEPMHFDAEVEREELARQIMARYHEWLEDVIRRYPEQYLWAHRRWRKTEEGGDSETNTEH